MSCREISALHVINLPANMLFAAATAHNSIIITSTQCQHRGTVCLSHLIQQLCWHPPSYMHTNGSWKSAAHLSCGCSSTSSSPFSLQLLDPSLALIHKLSNLWCLLCMLCLPCFELALACIPLLVCALQVLLKTVQMCLLLLDLAAQLLYAGLVNSSCSSVSFCSLLLLQLSLCHGILNQHLSHTTGSVDAIGTAEYLQCKLGGSVAA